MILHSGGFYFVDALPLLHVSRRKSEQFTDTVCGVKGFGSAHEYRLPPLVPAAESIGILPEIFRASFVGVIPGKLFCDAGMNTRMAIPTLPGTAPFRECEY